MDGGKGDEMVALVERQIDELKLSLTELEGKELQERPGEREPG